MNGRSTLRRAGMLALVALVAGASPSWGDDQEGRYSGIVVTVDPSAGMIVVEGMGPWQIKEGVTQVERRPVGVTSATAFVRVKRVSGPTPSGWVGDFVETGLPAWQVKPGEWVTAITTAGDKKPTAIRIYVWEPSEPPG
jgi:hypothetical protein